MFIYYLETFLYQHVSSLDSNIIYNITLLSTNDIQSMIMMIVNYLLL